MSRLASRLPTWPFVIVVVCLFILSLLAPMVWQSRHVAMGEKSQGGTPLAGKSAVEETARQPSPTFGDRAISEQVAEALVAESEPTVASEAVAGDAPPNPPARPTPQGNDAAPGWNFVAAEAPWDGPPRQYPGQITVDPSFPSDPQLPIAPAERPTADRSPPESASDETADERADRSPPSPADLTAPRNRLEGNSKAPARTRSAISPEPTTPSVTQVWPAPTALLQAFDALDQEPACKAWLAEARQELARLATVASPLDPSVTKSLDRLQHLGDDASRVARKIPSDPVRGQFLRAAYALARRLAVWTSILEFAEQGSAAHHPTLGELQEFVVRRAAVQALVQRREYAEAWSKYLQLEDARRLNPAVGQITDEQRAVARRMLVRLDATNLNDRQQSYLRDPVFDHWRRALRTFAQEPLDVPAMIAALERFELELSDRDSTELARGFQILHWSPRPEETRFAEPLNDHYRNANVRVAIAGDLINRLLHEPRSVDEPVNDMIRDAHVYGHSHTSARVRVELLPDRRQWRLGLEARGDVSATTQSRKGPATFLQDAWSNFSARKQLTVDRRGVRTERTEVRARSTSDLRSFETDFDHVPLFGALARAIARNQYHEQSTAAQAEVEQKVASRAREKLDQEVTQRLSDAEGEFHQKWLKPLQRLGLEPTAVDMETTRTRLIVRYRLAGSHQLAAHTARPQAPANSWLSVQIHESAVNNTLSQLGFEGRRIALRELYQELAARFDRPSPTIPEDIPDNVTVLFDDHDAVRIRCEQNRVSITLRIAELAQGSKNRWKNFVVRAYYVPVIDQRDANLVRDGIIELSGEKRSLGNQVVLRGIFAKVLSHNRPINLVNQTLAKKPELSDLEVNQFVILDGWIGVALAPKSNTARVPYRQPVR